MGVSLPVGSKFRRLKYRLVSLEGRYFPIRLGLLSALLLDKIHFRDVYGDLVGFRD